MLALRFPRGIEKRLERLAAETGRTKTYYAKEAIREFLDAEEDYLHRGNPAGERSAGIPIEEVERRLGLAN